MSNVVIISGHPDLSQSVANVTILEELKTLLPEADIRQLSELYPDGNFNLEVEQKALLQADVIVWQFPFHWYSVPALLKKWIDDVFVNGFSHGSAKFLKGKKLVLSITTGAPAVAYTPEGVMKHSVEELLFPFESLASLCELDLQKPIYTNGVSYTGRQTQEGIDTQKAEAKKHAERLVEFLKGMF